MVFSYISHFVQQAEPGNALVIIQLYLLAAERLSNFKILVGNQFDQSSFDSSGYSTCASVQGALGAGETRQTICDQAAIGRYVVVQLTGSDYLTLCEVAVYASGERIFRNTVNAFACITGSASSWKVP